MVKSLIARTVAIITICVPVSAAEPERETWEINGVVREALVYVPAQARREAAPLVFAFHGHGGAARQAARAFRVQEHWPEAIVVYAMGHSNGGAFTYLLWATRGDVLAAVAPSGAAAGRSLPDLKPKPVLHVAGEKDELVRFEW